MIPVLRIRDKDGNVRPIIAIRGAKGEAGSVTSVNGVSPDEKGNVVLDLDGGGGAEIPSALPNPHALTVNGTSYDGSKAVNIDIDVPTDEHINELIDAKIVVGTEDVVDGSASPYAEGTLYVVIEGE